MQLFPCPFCGLRDETEFFYGGEAGNDRPEPAAQVGAESWSGYLYLNHNPRGNSREIWVHLTCDEVFVMQRDTLTHAVTGSKAFDREPDK